MIKRSPAIAELIKLQEDIGHLLSDLTGISRELYNSANHWTPNLDLSENDTEITVTAEVPGVGQSDLEVVFNDGCLQIRGEKRQPSHSEKVRYLCLERGYGKFDRTIYLTAAVDINAASTRLRDGVLTVTLPKLSNRRNQQRVLPIEL